MKSFVHTVFAAVLSLLIAAQALACIRFEIEPLPVVSSAVQARQPRIGKAIPAGGIRRHFMILRIGMQSPRRCSVRWRSDKEEPVVAIE